jgi:hypothetical protein
VIIVPQAEPEPQTTVNVNLPGSVIYTPRRSRRSRREVVVVKQRPVYTQKREVGVVYRRGETTTTVQSCSRSKSRNKRGQTVCVVSPKD